MSTRLSESSVLLLPWFRIFIVILLALGIFFRFVNLDRKVYWGDEALTSLRSSGYTEAELIENVFNGRETSISELRRYQQVNPDKNLGDTVRALSLDAPEHPPLYFVMARLWMQEFGNSIAVKRALPAVLSLLTFPCLYWLCLELFGSALVSWIAVALFAVSPLQVLYAQEARHYSLWTVLTLLSSLAFLRALRLSGSKSEAMSWARSWAMPWPIYGVTVALQVYTALLAVPVILGHGLYILLTEGFRWSQKLKSYLLATGAGLLCFVPWLLTFSTASSKPEVLATAPEEAMAPLSLAKLLGRGLSYLFFDVQLDYDKPFAYLMPPIILLVGYAIYFLQRHGPRRASFFVWILIASVALPLILLDFATGTERSANARYLMPSLLGIQIAVAYLLATQLTAREPWAWRTWSLVMVTLLSCGIVSCSVSTQAEAWWNKYHSYFNPDVAEIINKAERPLLVGDGLSNLGNIMALSHLLDSKVQLQFFVRPDIPTIASAGYSDVFALKPGEDIRNNLMQQGYEIEPVFSAKHMKLWRLQK
ncbi:glycosyltransferase family 39 protein [Leptolyngbya sp. FACHB-261]|uniref:glycosyltransferase family 39 protein n=1 Tax=Leptolyngbya sp. FACHB-261 TaxID=2692806 RepID=UPI001684ABCD|nr:glycosyltransferase family 39 protein [Leptolyngbya sp. FACHB-261]MBD2103162.1 glycosyltransferase family 39 protein [Leptolyngbya sp. FACHB-261]